MTLTLNINEELQEITASPNERLVSILRNQLHLCEAKLRCGDGTCGACTILFGGLPVRACILPFYASRDKNIVTFEHFCKTKDYNDIFESFSKLNISLCDHCYISTIFAIHAFLQKKKNPTKQDATNLAEEQTCHCIENQHLISAILLAAKIRRERNNEKY